MSRRTAGVVVVVLALLLGLGSAFVEAQQYRFVMMSHIGSIDPNMKWLTISLAEFERKYPDVKTEYVATDEYSLPRFITRLRQVIATQPDGIAVSIIDSEALDEPLREAIDRGIPVVAFNIPDPRPREDRIPYLTYVGGDEYLTGLRLGEYTLEQAKAGRVPMPTKVVVAIHDATHQGLQARARGMADAMAQANVPTENLFISADPARAHSVLTSYLNRERDVNYIYTVASWSSPWAYNAAQEVGRNPGTEPDSGMVIITVDASPVALAGVQQGKVLVTNSQGFWLQGFVPMEWLYWYNKWGLYPQTDIITGPVIVDRNNVDQWEQFVRSIFGDEEYDQQVTW